MTFAECMRYRVIYDMLPGLAVTLVVGLVWLVVAIRARRKGGEA